MRKHFFLSQRKVFRLIFGGKLPEDLSPCDVLRYHSILLCRQNAFWRQVVFYDFCPCLLVFCPISVSYLWGVLHSRPVPPDGGLFLPAGRALSLAALRRGLRRHGRDPCDGEGLPGGGASDPQALRRPLRRIGAPQHRSHRLNTRGARGNRAEHRRRLALSPTGESSLARLGRGAVVQSRGNRAKVP